MLGQPNCSNQPACVARLAPVAPKAQMHLACDAVDGIAHIQWARVLKAFSRCLKSLFCCA